MAHEYEKLIKCPYCDHEWEDSWEFDQDEGEHECGSCGREFNVVREIQVTYSTSKKDCEDDKHEYELAYHHIKNQNFDTKTREWTSIPEEEWRYWRLDKCKNCDDSKYTDLSKEEYYEQTNTK